MRSAGPRGRRRLTAVAVAMVLSGVGLVATVGAAATEVAPQLPTSGGAGAGLAAFVEGMFLGLVPSLLPLLLIHLRASHRRQRLELGVVSLVWPPVLGSFAGLLIWLSLARALAHGPTQASILESPGALAALALPQLLFALAFWLAADRLSALDRTDGLTALTSLLAPMLALPWLPLTPALAALVSGVGTTLEAGLAGALAAAGFTLPVLLASLGAAVLSRTEGEPGWQPPAVLGFLPFLGLIWISYLLLGTLPAHVLAFVQLGWLALALLARLAVAGRGARRAAVLVLLTVALAAGTVWLAATGGGLG